MIVSGSPVSALKALEIGLVDQLIDEQGLAASAIAYARTIDAPRRTRDRRVSSDAGAFERFAAANARKIKDRSEEHTSELQSLMRISYAVFCLKKKRTKKERVGV